MMFPCNQFFTLLLRWKWNVLVVDEAHRLKDQKSLLHQTLTKVLSSTYSRLLLFGFFICPILIIILHFPPVHVVCVVLCWLQSPANRNPHPEQPAGALLPAELHSAQHLYRWWGGRLRQLILKCTKSTGSWYDSLCVCTNLGLQRC